jgi:type I restriction enzyme S subunit
MEGQSLYPPYDSYQDSGIDWVGDIPSHWGTQKGKWLFEKKERPVRPEDDIVTAFRDGMVTLRSNRRTEGFTNAVQEHGYQGIRKGDLVIHAMDAFAGAIGVSDSDGKATPVYAACVNRGEFDTNSHYYAYLLRFMSKAGYIEALAKGIRERSTDFRFNDFGKLLLPLPPKDEQDRIANFLDQKTAEIDEAIAKKQRLIELLKEQKAILINQAVTKGLNPDVPMRDSGVEWIGEVPRHWEVRGSKYLFAQRKELARKDDVQLSATQAYGVIPQDEYENLIGRRVVKIQFHLEKRKHVELDDFVISMRSFQGGLERAWSTGCIRSSYVVLKATQKINATYYSLLLKSRDYILALQSTANFIRDGQDLNYNNFAMVSLPIPPLSEQKAMAVYLEERLKLTDAAAHELERHIQLLKELKTSLINEAVTGKIKL